MTKTKRFDNIATLPDLADALEAHGLTIDDVDIRADGTVWKDNVMLKGVRFNDED